MSMRRLRVGIFAGTFDPVHGGHLSFALKALREAELDEICFLPERLPAEKPEAEHFAHRVAMLRRALKPHPQFSLLEVVERRLTLTKTLPRLHATFPQTQLVFILGAEVFGRLDEWAHSDRLAEGYEFIVGIRHEHDRAKIQKTIQTLGLDPKNVTVLGSVRPEVTATSIRQAIRGRRPTQGLLRSVYRYARKTWLYPHIR